jgi:hypothetical protein
MKTLRAAGLLLLISISVATTTGCLEVIPYSPQPAKEADPLKALDETVRFGVDVPTKVEVTDGYLKVVYGPDSGLGTQVLRFESIADMRLVRGSGWFGVQVFNVTGEKLTEYHGRDITTAQRFMDALAAARAKGSKKP